MLIAFATTSVNFLQNYRLQLCEDYVQSTKFIANVTIIANVFYISIF